LPVNQLPVDQLPVDQLPVDQLPINQLHSLARGVSVGAMSFFGELPEPEPEPSRVHHPWEPPQAEFPGIARIDLVDLVRTDQIAVAIAGISAYPSGFELFAIARLRADGGPGNPGPGAPADMARRSFRFGMQLSDGRKVIGEHGKRRPDPDSEPTGPILWQYLGGRGPHTHFSRWWAWPLPPPGPLEFVVEWPAAGIAETRAGLDAQLILDAARRSIRLWPDES
jgi:hypothetical protein